MLPDCVDGDHSPIVASEGIHRDLRADTEINEIVKEHLSQVYKTVKLMRRKGYIYDFDDQISWGMEALLYAVRTHDPSKGRSLKSWIFKIVQQKVKTQMILGYRKAIATVSLDDVPEPEARSEQMPKYEEDVARIICVAKLILPDTMFIAFHAYYVDKKTFKEIAADYGMKDTMVQGLVLRARYLILKAVHNEIH